MAQSVSSSGPDATGVSRVPGSSTGIVVGVNPGDQLPPSLAGTADTTTPGGPTGNESATSAASNGSTNAAGSANQDASQTASLGSAPDHYPPCKTRAQDRCKVR